MRKDEYINEVISKIENKKARREVEKELSAHIDDRISYYTDAGWDEETANEKAMEHMGEPEKVSNDLNLIHKRSSVLSCGIVVIAVILLVIIIPQFLLQLWIQIPIFRSLSHAGKQELTIEEVIFPDDVESYLNSGTYWDLSDYEEEYGTLTNNFKNLNSSKRKELLKSDFIPVEIAVNVMNNTDQYLIGAYVKNIEYIKYNGVNITFYQEKRLARRIVGDIGSVYQYEVDKHSGRSFYIFILISKEDYLKMIHDIDNVLIKVSVEGTKSGYGDGRADANEIYG